MSKKISACGNILQAQNSFQSSCETPTSVKAGQGLLSFMGLASYRREGLVEEDSRDMSRESPASCLL